MPSLRSSIRRRLEAEEAEQAQQQQDPVDEQDPIEEPNPVDEAEGDNPVEQAAAGALQSKLDEQPEPVVPQPEPREEKEDFTDEVNELNLQHAIAHAEIQGHKFGSRDYADAVASRLRQDTPRRERSAVPMMMAPVSRESPSWTSGRSTPSKTELTHEEIALAHSLGVDIEEYRRNKAKMHQMKASGVIQE